MAYETLAGNGPIEQDHLASVGPTGADSSARGSAGASADRPARASGLPGADGAATRSMSRRSFACGLAGALAGLALAPSVVGSLALATEGASAETEAALADAQSRYEAAQGQLSILQNQAFDAQAAYDQTSTDLYNTNQQIDELQVSINEKQQELAEAQDVLADRVNASYRAGSTGMLDVILSATNFDDFVNRVFYAGKTSDADAQAIQNVKDIKASLQADQDALQEQKAQQQAELETLNAQVAETESYVASLDSEVQGLIAQRNAEIQAAAEAARRAAEEEAARQAALQQQQQQGGGNTGATGGDAGAGDTGSGDSGSTGGDYDDGGWDDGGSGDSGSSGGSSSGGGSGYQPANVVSAAYNYIGTPYSVMDCSGLTSQAYADCGYYLYHQSGVQYNTVANAGGIVGAGSLVPGNLVFYSRGGSIYHVALYIGDGYVIDSIPNGGVQVRDMYFVDGFCGGGSPF